VDGSEVKVGDWSVVSQSNEEPAPENKQLGGFEKTA
jgi:hypothetical protein